MVKYIKVLFIVISVSEGCWSQVNKDTFTSFTSINTNFTSKNTTASQKNTTASLPIPYPKYLAISDPATVTVRWDPVHVRANNPILGFKVKLWEDQKQKLFKYVERDGVKVLIEQLVPIEKSFHVLPTHEPAFVAVVTPDVFTATFNVKIGEHYELRAQTFNADGDGPLSNSYGFKIHPSEKDKK